METRKCTHACIACRAIRVGDREARNAKRANPVHDSGSSLCRCDVTGAFVEVNEQNPLNCGVGEEAFRAYRESGVKL